MEISKQDANYWAVRHELDNVIKKPSSSFNDKELEKFFNATPETIKRIRDEEPKDEKDDISFFLDEKGKKVDIDKVSKSLVDKFNFKTVYGRKGEEVFVYNNGIYHSNGREVIKTEAEKILGAWAKNYTITEIFEKVKRMTAISKKDFENVSPNLLPLENCIYDVKNNITFEYSPDFYFRFKIPVTYVKTAKCNKFLKFIKETLCPDDILVIQEWFGFCLYRKYFIKKGMIWAGERDTGKTVLLSVLIRFVGSDNTSGISLQRISGNDKFAPATLYEKLLNAYDDLSSKDISDSGGFKIATGGGYITAEYKFGDSFQFVNYAKLTFACNKIPPIKDLDDEAYYFRWLPIEFVNQVPEGKQDKFLDSKLTTDEELSGILNWALEGLKRLIKNGNFSYNKSPEEVKRIIDRSGNPLAGFVQDCLIESVDNKITKEEMYEAYCEWAKNQEVTRLSKEQIGRQLHKYASFITPKTGKERYWKGASLKVNLDTLDTSKKTLLEVKEENIKCIDKIKNNPSNPSSPLCCKCDSPDAFITINDKSYCSDCAREVSQ